MPDIKPSKEICNKAIKLLEQYERLCEKKGLRLNEKRLAKLNDLRMIGEIKAGDLPATLQAEFPFILRDYPLKIVRFICGKSRR